MSSKPSSRVSQEITSPKQVAPNSDGSLPFKEHETQPDKPFIVIDSKASDLRLGLSDLWRYRELLYFLTWRDIKVRYKQTVLGAAWAIMQPLFTMLVFTLLFGRLAGVSSDNIPYPLFSYSGLLLWTFFANAVANSANSLVGSSNLITKVYFPRAIIPIAAVAAGLLDLAVASLFLIGLVTYYGVALTWSIALLPVFVALTTLFAIGVGLLTSALNVKYRDIRYALPFVIQLWMFVSSVVVPSSVVSSQWRWVFKLNPLTGIIEGFRASLLGQSINWRAIAISTAMTIGLLLYSAYFFRRSEESFADVI